jgi:hypothetical protein
MYTHTIYIEAGLPDPDRIPKINAASGMDITYSKSWRKIVAFGAVA